MKFAYDGQECYRWSGMANIFSSNQRGYGTPIRCVVICAAGDRARVKDVDPLEVKDPIGLERWVEVHYLSTLEETEEIMIKRLASTLTK